jgi:hypothetical protein
MPEAPKPVYIRKRQLPKQAFETLPRVEVVPLEERIWILEQALSEVLTYLEGQNVLALECARDYHEHGRPTGFAEALAKRLGCSKRHAWRLIRQGLRQLSVDTANSR